MNYWQGAIVAVVLAYLGGSLPFGYWAGRFKGIDIRKHGSGNIGATNVIRVLGKKVGIPVFILDVLKGLVPTVAVRWWLPTLGATDSFATIIGVFCAAAAVIGHNYTFWLGFKGGKGVATSAGGLLGLAPLSLLIAFVVWVIVFITSRYVALASIVAAAVLPIAMVIIMTVEGRWNHVLLGLGIVMGVFITVRHRSNIRRLLSGTENRFVPKKRRS